METIAFKIVRTKECEKCEGDGSVLSTNAPTIKEGYLVPCTACNGDGVFETHDYLTLAELKELLK